LLGNRVISEVLSYFGVIARVLSPFRTLFQGTAARGNRRGMGTRWSLLQGRAARSSRRQPSLHAGSTDRVLSPGSILRSRVAIKLGQG